MPEDFYVDRDGFLARCTHSDQGVLTCVERARQEVQEIERLAGVPAAPSALRMLMPSRWGSCVTRERLQFALRTGELAALARMVASGDLPVAPTSGPGGRCVRRS